MIIYTDGAKSYLKDSISIWSTGPGVAALAMDAFIERGFSDSQHQSFIIGIQDRNDGSKTVTIILDIHYGVSINTQTLVSAGLAITGANPLGTIDVSGGSGYYNFTFTLLS